MVFIVSPNGGHIVISASVRLFFILLVCPSVRIIFCVRFSSKTTRPISPIHIPIYRGNNVDLQHILYIYLHPSMTAGQGQEILQFCEFRCLTGSSLCSLLLRNYSTDFSMLIPIYRGNNVDLQCILHFDLHPSMTAGKGYELLQFWEFRCLTGSSLCSLLLRNYSTDFSMLIPIYRGNNVDLQCILHFDLHPSMTAGKGYELLQFWEFKCLTGSSLCSLLLRNYSTHFSNADTNLPREQCRFAMCTSF